jgi:hypothetical protein
MRAWANFAAGLLIGAISGCDRPPADPGAQTANLAAPEAIEDATLNAADALDTGSEEDAVTNKAERGYREALQARPASRSVEYRARRMEDRQYREGRYGPSARPDPGDWPEADGGKPKPEPKPRPKPKRP